jgi:hypothetical protein
MKWYLILWVTTVNISSQTPRSKLHSAVLRIRLKSDTFQRRSLGEARRILVQWRNDDERKETIGRTVTNALLS